MCGISGFFSRNHRADSATLEAMLNVIGYRGPDECTGFVKDGAALGSVRLSIVDLLGGTQPALARDGRVAVVFNGEIYNYRKLMADLELSGIRFSTNSEVETLLNLFLSFGEGMFERIRGQFAVAVWDGRENRLYLARDRVGINPLFWHLDDRGITFASEIKALAARPHIRLRLNPQSLVQTFRLWTNVGDTSAFEGIHQVPPAHYLVFDGRDVRLQRYWDWPLPDTVEPLHFATDSEYTGAFADAFNASIERQRMADVPVASFLSGGIDSSAVAAVFQRQLGNEKLKTYSVTFDDAEYDESEAQRKVSEHLGLDHTSINISPRDISDHFRRIVWHAETPLFRAAATPLFLLSKRVREDGIKVVLTGEGADELLLGYNLFREVAVRRFWSRNPNSEWRGHLLRRLYQYLPQFQNPRYFNLLREFYRQTLIDPDNPHYAMSVRWSGSANLGRYFSAEMREFASSHDPISDLERWLPRDYWRADDISKAQSVEVSTLLGNYLLSSQGDRMALAHSVEARYPYLDDEFIEFCARLPKRIKLRGLADKFVLRNAVKGLLPDEVRKRPKIAYSAPDINGFVVNGRLPDYAADLLSSETISRVGLFDAVQVENLRKRATGSTISRTNFRDNMAFVLVLSTMALHDMFVEGNRPAVPINFRPITLVDRPNE
jgi:asparagine synthase (glutamine-hydrolysing)